MSSKRTRKLLRRQKRKERSDANMSKIIALTPELIEKMRSESTGPLTRNKFTKVFDEKLGEKATLYFTLEAWTKMTALLRECSKEVAWHGVAQRVDGEKNAYRISDIMVYPQTVGPATVDMDEIAYTKWLIEHDGDERFDHIRFQGHSHVNMATSPSATDMQHQEEILSQLGPEDFYVFAIYNKSLSRDIKIYDMATNRMYDTTDVTVKIDWGFDMDGFMEESKSLVKEKVYSYTGYQYDSYTGRRGDDSNSRPVTPGGSGSKEMVLASAADHGKPVSRPEDGGWDFDSAKPFPAGK